MDKPTVQVYLNRSIQRDDEGQIDTPESRPYQLEIRIGKLALQSAWLFNSDEKSEANLEQLAAILEETSTVECVFASLNDPRENNAV